MTSFRSNGQDIEASKESSPGLRDIRTERHNLGQVSDPNIDIDNVLGGVEHVQGHQTNALLHLGSEPNRFDRFLSELYYSRRCSYFYIGLLIIGCLLILTTIIDGFKVAESPTFITVELCLNILISLDLLFRVRMVGFNKYLSKSCWNKLDLAIVIGCNLLFVISILSQASYEIITDELLLCVWAVAQSFRMVIIARKQRQAIRSAKNLIDFSNIGPETERAVSNTTERE